MGRRRFAKNSEDVRHFRLVARSQADPCGKDADVTPLVLEPFVPTRLLNRKDVDEAELLTIPESLQKLGPEVFGLQTRGDAADQDDEESEDDEECEEEKRLADLDDDCYFPKDGYNYHQHLKTMGTGKKGGVGGVIMEAPKRHDVEVVSEDAFKKQPATNDEEKEALAALEEADLYEELDDGLLEQILPGGAAEPVEVHLWGKANFEEASRMPDLATLRAMHRLELAGGEAGDADSLMGGEFTDETGAPVSNEQFDQFLNEEYNDDEIGGMDDDEIVGPMTEENLEEILDEYLEDQKTEQKELLSIYEPQEGKLDDVPRVIEETKAIIERHYADEPVDGDDGTSLGADDSSEDESRTWDCETILTTLSNVSNRPGKIGRIKVVKKQAPPAKQLRSIDESEVKDEEEEDEEDQDVVELPDVVTERSKDETPEEKKARKAGVKEMRRICRKMKKESKEMYKNEASKLVSQPSHDVRGKARYTKL